MKIVCFFLGLAAISFVSAWPVCADDGLDALINHSSTQSPPPAPAPAAPTPLLRSSSESPPPSTLAPPAPPTDPLVQANAAIDQKPNDAVAYIIRGNVYGRRKMWDEARQDYEKALALDPKSEAAKLDIAEVQFRQKQYDGARAGFLSAEGDPNFGDLAAYLVFLCDLFGAHEAQASQELAAFNAAAENPSYYYSNVAWDITHQNLGQARDYLDSAQHIYKPSRSRLYLSNLIEMGYLPLKD